MTLSALIVVHDIKRDCPVLQGEYQWLLAGDVLLLHEMKDIFMVIDRNTTIIEP
jgi:hypothetical protein